MVLECVIINAGVFVIEYIHSTMFILVTFSNPLISLIYLCKHIKEPEIFFMWAFFSVTLHISSYIIYITRPVNSHPNVIRRGIRAVLPLKLWKLLLCRTLYKKIEKCSIIAHLFHMAGMVVFCLVFGIYIKPELYDQYGKEDSLLSGLLLYCLITSIILSLDIFVMEILVALLMLPVLPVSFCIYCCAWCCCPRVRDAMNRLPGGQHSEEDMDFLFHFKRGMSWQQLLLYIYKNNKIIFKKVNFREHFDDKDLKHFLTPVECTPEINKSGHKRGSFLTGDATRKNSEMNLMIPDDSSVSGSPDNSFTPIRPYDAKLQAFMQDIEDEFKFSDEGISNALNLKKCEKETPRDYQRAESPPKRLDEVSARDVSDVWDLPLEARKSEKKTIRRFSIIKSRPSIKKIDRGIVCTICQDDIEENDTVLQLECGRTHLLHFGCLKEWLTIKFECPTCRTNLLVLYKDKIREEAAKNNQLSDDDNQLYAEDLIPLQKAREKLLNEIDEMENTQKQLEESSSKK
ncbi:unnamed protein product [Moneuplotes crassus]|uniref:RING-type E3 ubiquitin transferase n=1 Tax=Euplotes crassus TaxID=5936 RepID=A0AAD1U8M4_EUPCR|nr:unnamed protein product [Moneuplotes crassus]